MFFKRSLHFIIFWCFISSHFGLNMIAQLHHSFDLVFGFLHIFGFNSFDPDLDKYWKIHFANIKGHHPGHDSGSGCCKPFFICDQQVGIIRPDFWQHLSRYGHVFIHDTITDTVTLNPDWRTYDERSAKMENLLQELRRHNIFTTLTGWREEVVIRLSLSKYHTPNWIKLGFFSAMMLALDLANHLWWKWNGQPLVRSILQLPWCCFVNLLASII